MDPKKVLSYSFSLILVSDFKGFGFAVELILLCDFVCVVESEEFRLGFVWKKLMQGGQLYYKSLCISKPQLEEKAR